MNYKEFFETNGYLIIKNAIGQEIVDKYEREWDKENLEKRNERGLLEGWEGHSSYLQHDLIKDILCHQSIQDVFVDIEKGVALHSSRTYGTSTEMPWHHDSVLPNEVAGDNYIGVWVAIEDVTEDSGPFEFIPGSHIWDIDFSEAYSVAEIGSFEGNYGSFNLEEEISKRNVESVKFLANRGDVLVWHGRLVHRGSIPKNKAITRKALIGHYCNGYANIDATNNPPSLNEAITQLVDDSSRFGQWKSGGFYFK